MSIMFLNNIVFFLFIHIACVGETGIVNISGVGEMGVGKTGVGDMGQIIGETGLSEMGVGETGTSLKFTSKRHYSNNIPRPRPHIFEGA